jgi:hypothetical protein
MEKVIDCPICFNTDKCFEEAQKEYSSYLCFNCGFMSDSRYEIDSIFLMDNLKSSPKLVQDTKVEDKHRGIVWFPAVINMGELGIIFPEGTPEEYNWKYAKVIEIPEEERDNYDNYDKRLDVENAQEFGKHEFFKACKEMGITENMKGKL